VSYFPRLIKDPLPAFPRRRVLVLLPIDKRQAYQLQNSSLPPSQDNTAILGIFGLNAHEGIVRISSPLDEHSQIPHSLGAQHRMKAGIPQPPDIPRRIFTLTNLPYLVQDAIETNFADAGVFPQKVDVSSPSPSDPNHQLAHFALGCTIEQFSLISLERTKEVPICPPLTDCYIVNIPSRGPTRADVSLALTLYHLPSGQTLWKGKVAASVDDPPLEESEFIYASSGEVLSMALSRAVGSILSNQELQAILLQAQQQSAQG
jgi:hypothetical protein